MKLKQILFAAAVVAMATACNHATDDTTPAPAPKGVSVSLVASADTDETTRTALGIAENGSYKYEWSAGDQIGVSVISEGTEVLSNVALKSGSSGVSTTFGGTISEADAAKIPAAQLYDYVGYYPATASYNHSEGQFSFTLPATHSASSNVFSGACDFMVATAEERSTIAVSDGMYPLAMRFQHVFAFFEIPLKSNNLRYGISKIEIEASESPLAGAVVVEKGTTEIKTVNNGSKKLTVEVPQGWNTSENIWVPFIPGAAGEQIKITLSNGVDSWSFTKTAPAAGFTRANVYRMSGADPEGDVKVSLDKILTLINNENSTIKDPTALSLSVSTSGVDAAEVEDLGVIYSHDGAAEVEVSLANNTTSASQTWPGLQSGEYTVKAYVTVGGTDFVSASKSVDVFGEVALSVVAPTSYSWYVGDNGQTKNVTTANSKDRLTIYAPTATMTAKDSRYADKVDLLKGIYSASIKVGTETLATTANGLTMTAGDKQVSDVGAYTVTATATFGTYTATATTTSRVTGLPYYINFYNEGNGSMDIPNNDSWANNNMGYRNTGITTKFYSTDGGAWIAKGFYIPAAINITTWIRLDSYGVGTTNFTLGCSASASAPTDNTITIGDKRNLYTHYVYDDYTKDMTMSKNYFAIGIGNDNGYIYELDIKYR